MKTALTKVTDWAARLAGACSAVAELHETDKALRAAHAAAIRERLDLINAPAPVEEVLATLNDQVDALGRQWAADHGLSLILALGPGLAAQRDGALTQRPAELPDFLYQSGQPLTLAALVGAFPEVVKARLAAVVKATPYTAGPPTADRARLVAEADARIAKLEAEHSELVDAAADFDPPIELKLLPAVAERRIAQEEQRTRTAAADAARREREAAVNERVEPQGPRTLSSPYLAAMMAHRRGQ